ncbi:MAG TPA: maleylpyruvate isomerase family mycothiol-dependent enzyme [Candidatus Sulfotelmatobacter sp.]|nr:maleylpyruvate isomerase family mycothiol-dependent enzyme [Candidatus Sulfotelmatobacter sp.]
MASKIALSGWVPRMVRIEGEGEVAGKPDYAGLTAVERAAMGEMLASLSEAQWSTPSLCAGWSVRDLALHLASEADVGMARFVATLASSGFSPDKVNQKMIDLSKGRSAEEITRIVADPAIKGLFKLSPAGALTEAFIHQQDMRRPLDMPRAYSEECLRATADAVCNIMTGTGAKKRIKGLRLAATDIEWQHGQGPEVTGTAEALIMAAAGRRVALDDLSGEGKTLLASR